MKYATILLLFAAAWLLSPQSSEAACSAQTVQQLGDHVRYTGDCENDNEVLITTGDVSQYEACMLVSTTGAVDVAVSLDGTTYTTAPVSLIDMGSTSTAPVIVTAALRLYAFPLVGVASIRVLQNGATDAAAQLTCG